MSINTKTVTSFLGPGHMFEMIFTEMKRIGAEFKEEISKEKMIDIAKRVSNFAFDTRFALLDDDVVYKEIAIGSERILLQRQERCYLVTIFFQDKTHEIEYRFRGLEHCDSIQGPNEMTLRSYEILNWRKLENIKGITPKSKL